MKQYNYSFFQRVNANDSFDYSCEIGYLTPEKLTLTAPTERDISIHEIAFVELKTKRNFKPNYIVGSAGIFFIIFGFLLEQFFYTIFVGLILFSFALFYKKFNYVVLIILRNPEKIFITFNQNKIDEIKKFIKSANHLIDKVSGCS